MLNSHLQLYVDALGLHAASRVLAEYGGQTCDIPSGAISPAHKLAALLGLPLARNIQARFSCGTYQLPMPDKVFQKMRNREIVEQLDNGHTKAELVAKYGITRQQISNIQKEHEHGEVDDDQLSFGF